MIIEKVTKAVNVDGTPGFVLAGGVARLHELKQLADVNARRTLDDATVFDIDLDSAHDGSDNDDDDADGDDADEPPRQNARSSLRAQGQSVFSGRTRYRNTRLDK